MHSLLLLLPLALPYIANITSCVTGRVCGAGEGLETAGSAPTLEEGDPDIMAQADRARQKAFGRLDTFLDENGGINDPAKAGGVMHSGLGVRPTIMQWLHVLAWRMSVC